MNYEKIVTLYDNAEHAEAARRNLVAAGFPASEISMINNKTLALAGDKLREPGLWHRLFSHDCSTIRSDYLWPLGRVGRGRPDRSRG